MIVTDERRRKARRIKTLRSYVAQEGFAECFEENRKLVYWWCRKLARCFGGWYLDYLGTVAIKLSAALQHWKEDRGTKFSTYFSNFMVKFYESTFLAFESEAWAKLYSNNTSMENVKITNENFAYHESDFRLWRIPDKDDDWCREILGQFNSSAEAWEFLVRGLNWREREILIFRFKNGWLLEQVGQAYGITKQRAQQIQDRAFEKIRERVKKLEDFAELFKETEELQEMGVIERADFITVKGPQKKKVS